MVLHSTFPRREGRAEEVILHLPTFQPSNLLTFQLSNPQNLQTFQPSKPSNLSTFKPFNFPTFRTFQLSNLLTFKTFKPSNFLTFQPSEPSTPSAHQPLSIFSFTHNRPNIPFHTPSSTGTPSERFFSLISGVFWPG